MKVYIATDHAGYEMKESLIPFILTLGYEVEDCGAYEYNASDDYPDFIHVAAAAVSAHPGESYAIILGGSGQGEAMVANRYEHVRAAVYCSQNIEIVQLSREHNDANILSIGARFVDIDAAKKAVEVWLGTAFSQDERHIRRINKMEKHHE